MKEFREIVGFTALCCFVWALLFGVTVDGKHHAISCSEQRGLEIK